MDIRSTITQELAEDVSKLLQDYLKKAEPSTKEKFVNTASAVLSGIESRIPENAKHNIAKTGAYALGALGLMTGMYSLCDAIALDAAYDNVTYEAQTMGLAAGLGMGLAAIALFEQLKKVKEPVAASQKAIVRTEFMPQEVKQLISMVGKDMIDNPEKLIAELDKMPKASVEAIKEFAWINANREQIKSGLTPAAHQYDNKPATPPRMRM